ncbi:MAG: superfamily II DNA or RNA helicase [Paraglaciecola sp.]|jgi:superfamily II DNA or RNA helicase
MPNNKPSQNEILTSKNFKNTKNKIFHLQSAPSSDNKIYTTIEITESWYNSISIVEENRDKNIQGLREPQAGAIYNTLGHWKSSDEIGTIVLPTGIGKTKTILTLLAKQQCEKLLV